jgi:Protein of unknown function (DUF1570)
MKQVLLAAALLLGPPVGLASAEYMMIKVDVNKILALPPGPPQPGQQKTQVNTNNPQARHKKEEEPPLWAMAYLQLVHKPAYFRDPRGTEFVKVDHPWSKHDGKTLVPKDLKDLGTVRIYQQTSVGQRFINRKKELDAKSAEKQLVLAQWALEHGLRTEFEQTMAELGKIEPKHKSFVAYQQVRAAMARPVTVVDPRAASVVEEFTRENYRTLTSDGGHFAVLTDLHAGGQVDVDMKKWEERLEDNYRNFFYWFAARGKALSVPAYRLVAVVVAVEKDFQRKHESYGAGPSVAPGFLIQRPNVAVYCAQPIDEAYNKLEDYNKREWQMAQVGRDELLSGDTVAKRSDMIGNPMFLAKLQTLALLQKSIEKESARAATTHEGTLQLMVAAGLLPRGVIAGEWAHAGLASFFETPFHAFYFGTGLPHWNYLVEFKYLKKAGVLVPSDAVLLRTIGDRYFASAVSIQQQMMISREERETLEPLLDEELNTARTSAWALMYYLAKHRLDGLEKYFQELSNLPRDLEFDEAVLHGCFARAFSLGEAADPSKLDMAKVKSFAEAWFSSMEGESLDLIEVQSDALKERSERGHSQGQGAGAKTPP